MATLNSIQILNFLKKNYGKELSKQEIADALGISLPTVTGTVNALQKKNYCVVSREETVVDAEATETRKAKTRVIKYHTLTEAGLAYDPEKEEQEKAAEKAAKKAAKEAEKANK